ncbi:MAG TPA: cyclopropane fatty acyl phospholipid synthase [Candidatus Competibacteraceae bacterium]|nr:cyclopropane fatty acyl phospholipid synthase [Candidatus Competibacteraceae bacterium]
MPHSNPPLTAQSTLLRGPESFIRGLLEEAGIAVNGHQPWDIQVHNPDFYARVLRHGSLGLGESYMDGWWDCERLDELFYRVLRHGLDRKTLRLGHYLGSLLASVLFNLQSKRRAYIVGERHYDLGNDLFQAMLDPTMSYSCGYWKAARDLVEAQRHKLALICAKLCLQPGQRLLDIGCGWGGLAEYAARHHGVEVVGITISREQQALARERCAGLPVQIRLQDYRELDERFDRIVSVGMFEHVGYKNYRTYMKVVRRCLKDDGLMLLHTIGSNESQRSVDPWIGKYIFPNGMLPSIAQLGRAWEELLVMEDWHNFGADYDKTLMAWYTNFCAAWPNLRARYDERFFRMFRYYLLSCAGAFRARNIQLWQIVLSPRGVSGGYQAPR